MIVAIMRSADKRESVMVDIIFGESEFFSEFDLKPVA